jgi:hypothetical protein
VSVLRGLLHGLLGALLERIGVAPAFGAAVAAALAVQTASLKLVLAKNPPAPAGPGT